SNEYGNGHAYRQAPDINKGSCFVFDQVSPGNLEVVFKHDIAKLCFTYIKNMPALNRVIFIFL
ncbi:MAG: hypothetical protein ABIR18_09795, partial [Chitinophagaceae bacterium]